MFSWWDLFILSTYLFSPVLNTSKGNIATLKLIHYKCVPPHNLFSISFYLLNILYKLKVTGYTLGRFAIILTRETTIVTSCLRCCWKRVYSKRKEFVPMGSEFFFLNLCWKRVYFKRKEVTPTESNFVSF